MPTPDGPTDHARIVTGDTIFDADGRRGRPENLTYREALHATYQGPYTHWETKPWDGLVSNHSGLIASDPERGLILTMPAGQAEDGSYTTRDFASAPHGVDYASHFADWARDPSAHPNLVMPGRTAIFEGVRLPLLHLGDAVKGTGGCCLQDWTGIDFETMAIHGNTARSRFQGFGLAWLPQDSLFPRLHRLGERFSRYEDAFSEPVGDGIAPMYVILAQIGGWAKARKVHVDPDVPHIVAFHWTADGRTLQCWLDEQLALSVTEGDWVIPAGVHTRGRARFNRSGLHACAWQDNGSGNPDVGGVAGNPKDDQPYSVERLRIIATA